MNVSPTILSHHTVRIGCRKSNLSLFQANQVHKKLSDIGLKCSILATKSEGDISLKPIDKFNHVGIFTSTLDDMLLSDDIDIAVHSLKDVPTNIEPQLTVATVLNRGPHQDVLVYKKSFFNRKKKKLQLAA